MWRVSLPASTPPNRSSTQPRGSTMTSSTQKSEWKSKNWKGLGGKVVSEWTSWTPSEWISPRQSMMTNRPNDPMTKRQNDKIAYWPIDLEWLRMTWKDLHGLRNEIIYKKSDDDGPTDRRTDRQTRLKTKRQRHLQHQNTILMSLVTGTVLMEKLVR